MLNVFSSYNKVGDLEMTKSLFLYLKYKENGKLNSYKDIHCFNNNMIITVDYDEYNTKNERLKIQKELSVRPYFITRNIFKEFILFACSEQNKLLLRAIIFFDNYVMEEEEYLLLANNLLKLKFSGVYEQVEYIETEFDTKVKEITFRYEGYDFTLTAEGVLTYEATNKVFNDFLYDNKINNLILG